MNFFNMQSCSYCDKGISVNGVPTIAYPLTEIWETDVITMVKTLCCGRKGCKKKQNRQVAYSVEILRKRFNQS